MADGKPTWGNTCVQCTACIHRCPVQAIEWGKEGVLAPLLENLLNAALETPVYLAYTRIRRK